MSNFVWKIQQAPVINKILNYELAISIIQICSHNQPHSQYLNIGKSRFRPSIILFKKAGGSRSLNWLFRYIIINKALWKKKHISFDFLFQRSISKKVEIIERRRSSINSSRTSTNSIRRTICVRFVCISNSTELQKIPQIYAA